MMNRELKPLHDRILVRPFEVENVTPGGLVIPDLAIEKTQRGVVVAVGPGRRDPDGKLIPMDVKVGDEVVYAKYGGSEIKLEGGSDTLIVLAERDIHLRLV